MSSFVSCLQSAVSLSSSIVAMDSGSSKITPKLFLPESKTYGRRAISLSELDTGVSRDAERGKAKKTFSAQGANNFPSLSEVTGSQFSRSPSPVVAVFADALWDHVTSDSEELPFVVADTIEVTDMEDSEWWGGTCNGCVGWFPANYVRLRVVQDNLQMTASMQSSSASVRGKIIEEIISSERMYVGHLKDIVGGYIHEARNKEDLFDKDSISLIFSNVEEILDFQSSLLEQMESRFSSSDPAATLLGSIFVDNQSGFQVYSKYCNNHPEAMKKLSSCQSDRCYKFFFEACRLMRQMANLSLDSFLLTPVQKICKYPLQIRELLKHTDATHPDYQHVVQAYTCMSSVAEQINERKRRTECLERIASWQAGVFDWQGENMLKRSSVLLHSGELVKISKGKAQPRMFYLFDHQLVWCEGKEGSKLFYRGRLDTNDCKIEVTTEPAKDGDKTSLKYFGLSLYNSSKAKWYVLRARTEEMRDEWLKAFKQERELIAKDSEDGFAADFGQLRQSVQRRSFVGRRKSFVGHIRAVTPPSIESMPSRSTKDRQTERRLSTS